MKELNLDPEATYVLSGGLGGIGRSIAEFMFAAGARNISFLSRSGASTPGARRLLESLQVRGCNVQAYGGKMVGHRIVHASCRW
jgi:shikimate 5-dehydrogenase